MPVNKRPEKFQYMTYVVIFLTTCVLFGVFAFFTKIYPFGDDILLVTDGDEQYLSFYSYVKTSLLTHGMDYSWSKSLGGEVRALFAYYCASPYHILFLFTPKQGMPIVVQIVLMLKMATSAVTFAICMDNLTERKCAMYLIMASLAYAFMGYNISYGCLALSWLDGVMFLPLVVLGIHQLITQKKQFLYIVSLSWVIMSNFYIGYMICIFSVIIWIVFSLYEKVRLKYSCIRFALSSIVSGGITFTFWFPIIHSLNNGKLSGYSYKFTSSPNFKFLDLFTKFYTGTVNDTEWWAGIPHIYIGLIMFFLCISYFSNKNILLRAKTISFLAIALLVISFYISGINVIWHGWKTNECFNYRYSFLLSFIMIYLGYKSLSKLEGLNSIRICICLGVIAVMTWIAIMGKYPTIKDRYAYLDLIAVSIFALSLIFHNKQKATWVIKMATLLQIVMVLFNAVLTIRQMLPGLTHHTYKYYAEFLDSVEPAVDYVKRNDSSFYRMEKDFRYRGSDNDPMLLDYNGISHFSSTYDQNSLDFVRKLGFMQIMARASFGEGGSEGGNDLLGIKYFLSRESPPNQDDYELIECINGVNIWENKDVLGIATLSDSISDLNGILNPFEFQNSYINMLSSNSSNVYLPVTIEEISYNSLEKYGQDMLHNVTESSKVEYVFHVERKEPIYIYINQNNWKILLNGEPFETQSPYSQIIYLGEFDIGQKVTISLQPPATNGTSECVDAELSIYYENSELLNSKYNC